MTTSRIDGNRAPVGLRDDEARAVDAVQAGWAIDTLAEIVRIPSITGDEGAVQDRMAALLAEVGCRVERVEPDPADCTVDRSICELNEWRNGEYTRANVLMAVGSIVAAAGIGLVIGGAVVLVRNRNARASLGVAPMYTRRGTGLSLSGRF